MDLDLDKLRALIDLLTEKDVGEFEHEDERSRFKIVRGARVTYAPAPVGAPAPPPAAPAAGGSAATTSAASSASDDVVDIASPFVGTFYRASSPDIPAFVEIGSVVKAGQTMCIIEAMKLMNEIESECSGTVIEIYAQNGKAVEYGQKLFRIKKA
jgi:acetyl-CoA carboxylase biotin carboxyl carrier protein